MALDPATRAPPLDRIGFARGSVRGVGNLGPQDEPSKISLGHKNATESGDSAYLTRCDEPTYFVLGFVFRITKQHFRNLGHGVYAGGGGGAHAKSTPRDRGFSYLSLNSFSLSESISNKVSFWIFILTSGKHKKRGRTQCPTPRSKLLSSGIDPK